MSAVAIVYALFGTREEAERVAKAVVEERLAACANMLGECLSFYAWEGRMEQSAEVPVLFKTRKDKRDALMARIAELHSYEVPAVLGWPAERVHEPYAQWVSAQSC